MPDPIQNEWDVFDFFGPPIHVYTRAQAIADGFLVDASKLAKEAGFRWPVALTIDAWNECVLWTGEATQDETGRLWDVLWMAANAIDRAKRLSVLGDRLAFEVHRVPNGPRWTPAKPVGLMLVVGPGDTAAPGVTIMLPHES